MADDHLAPLRDPRPLYLRTEEALVRFLSEREPGEQLPPEPELAQRLGVSRSTLREALRVLKVKGLIARKQGVGTFVQSSPTLIPGGLETLESLDTLAGRLGLEVRTAQLVFDKVEAGVYPEVMEKLWLAPDDELTAVRRVKLTGARPVAFIEDLVPVAVVTTEELRASFGGSVLDVLCGRGDPRPDYARADIRVLAASRELGQKLELRPGAPLLLLEELLYSGEGRPIEFSRNYFVPGFFGFYVIRRIRSVHEVMR
jgi:GntR family transcriptional regulator